MDRPAGKAILVPLPLSHCSWSVSLRPRPLARGSDHCGHHISGTPLHPKAQRQQPCTRTMERGSDARGARGSGIKAGLSLVSRLSEPELDPISDVLPSLARSLGPESLTSLNQRARSNPSAMYVVIVCTTCTSPAPASSSVPPNRPNRPIGQPASDVVHVVHVLMAPAAVQTLPVHTTNGPRHALVDRTWGGDTTLHFRTRSHSHTRRTLQSW